MAIIRWNPWSIDRFFDEDLEIPTIPFLSRMAGQGLNIYETEKEIVVEAAVPGISEDKIDISVDEGVVRISAANQEKNEEKGQRRYYMSSMNTSYNYAFRLPSNVVGDEEPQCELNDGVLIMRFPKMQKTPPKKLKINKKSKTGAKENEE